MNEDTTTVSQADNLAALSDDSWSRMENVSKNQAEVLLAFAKAGLDTELQRSTAVTQKGTWTIATALALATVGISAVGWTSTHGGSVPATISMAVAVVAAILGGLISFFGVKMRGGWAQIRIEAILNEPLDCEEDATILRRRIASHYFDIYQNNIRQTERCVSYVSAGQVTLIAGVLLAAVVCGWLVVADLVATASGRSSQGCHGQRSEARRACQYRPCLVRRHHRRRCHQRRRRCH